MASATEPKTPTPEVTASTMPGVPLYLLTVEQYHAMARAGILTEGDRVELLDGVLAAKTTKNPPHVIATKLAAIELSRVLPSGWHLAKEDPVVILPRSEPEPDLAVVRGAIRDYPDHNPSPTDVALLAEVADFSLDHERTAKLRIYARAGLPTYWIVNLTDRRVEVYTDPSGSADEPTYWRREDFGPGAAVPLVLDGREVARIAVGDLLP